MTAHRQIRRTLRLLSAVVAAGALAVSGGPQLFLSSTPDARAAIIEQLLAIVNGKTIALSDLRRYQLLFASDVPPGRALQQMIDQQLLLAEVVRFDIEPPQADRVQEAVQRLEQLLREFPDTGHRADTEANLEHYRALIAP